MIEVKISVSGHGDDGDRYTRITRQATEPARAIALALAAVAETVHSPQVMAIAEAAYRITREGVSS